MAKIENLKPRRILPIKCCIDNQEVATKQIRFTFGWTMPICEDHFKEIMEVNQ